VVMSLCIDDYRYDLDVWFSSSGLLDIGAAEWYYDEV
jgi:hypothetical protein